MLPRTAMVMKAVCLIPCAVLLPACSQSGPYAAEIQQSVATIEQCKDLIEDPGNAEPIWIDTVEIVTSDLYAGVYENGKPFECRLVSDENGQTYVAAKYYRTKWRD